MSDHLTPRAAAARLGVSTRTLRRYVAAGLLAPASRTAGGHGRFDPDELDKLRDVAPPPPTPAEALAEQSVLDHPIGTDNA